MIYEMLLGPCQFFACIPAVALPYIAMAMAAAGTGLTLAGQKKQAEAQAEAQVETVKANNAVEYEKQAALRLQEAQTTESSAREMERARLANQSATATAKVAIGEASGSGNNVAALLSEYDMQLGQYRESISRQGNLDKTSIESQIGASVTGTKLSNLTINGPVAGPNYAAGIASFGGQALGIAKDAGWIGKTNTPTGTPKVGK